MVNDSIKERLLSLVVCHDSSGIELYNLLVNMFMSMGISMKNIVACAFDGAANMKGTYNGLQSHLKNSNSNIIYTHCMAHVLNLVICDSTKTCLEAENLFGLVEQSAVFLSDSHKRMSYWKKCTGTNHSSHNKLYTIQKIGATRWWSKDKALSSIIDIHLYSISENNEINNSKFVTFLQFLMGILRGNCNNATKFMAKTLLEKWSNFETIFIASLILDIFSASTPLSAYQQTKSLNYQQAWSMIVTLKQQILKKRNDDKIEFLYQKCKEFTKKINNFFESLFFESNRIW